MLNMIAVSYGATAALPFGTILVILLIYTFLAFPLLALGGFLGNLFRSEFQAPSAPKRYHREIPPLACTLLVTVVVVILLTAILSVGMTYIQLSLKDHEWWWRSLLCGGIDVCLLHLLLCQVKHEGSYAMQLSFFFGCDACMCSAFFLMLGTISFRASFSFVQHIYQAAKSD
ncbi:hypothetical protein Tsubulata_021831 [Turnera subulata]|uniref:Transmembrane 9 superfamily member n=1 Tax=Turnera subulata TaxID=218843 RepID=A0A9Q0G7Z1_9ROSI|nr:hypothetical protein Tsubulata_021831 [Turnera subulata]